MKNKRVYHPGYRQYLTLMNLNAVSEAFIQRRPYTPYPISKELLGKIKQAKDNSDLVLYHPGIE